MTFGNKYSLQIFFIDLVFRPTVDSTNTLRLLFDYGGS